MKPKLVMCNYLSDIGEYQKFVKEHGFSGIDWSFDTGLVPQTPAEESRWVKNMLTLDPLEVRYHCLFYKMDVGHDDPAEAEAAAMLFRRIVRLISKVRGRYLTIHIGLGRDSTEPLSWEATISNLRGLVQFGAEHRVMVCLENLAWGWTSRPNLFEKLIRLSGAGVTFDLGHAQSCESILSQQYAVQDFVTPHTDRVFNAHIYHREVSKLGHLPPENLADIEERLNLLDNIGCRWWVIEIKETEALLKTKKIIDAYLLQPNHRKHSMAETL
ncbi:TIM barrel protein [Thermodesulfobacteriota bacterium]